MVSLLLSCVTAIAVAVLLLAEARAGRTGRTLAKTTASLGFVALGVLRFSGAPLDGWILAALILGAIGDLLLTDERSFDLGLLAFLGDHVLLVVAVALLLPVSQWPIAIALPLIVLAAFVMRWLWPHLGRRRIPVVAYVIAIALMVWGVTAAALAGAWPWWAGVAALLFMVSDLTVARQRFIAPGLRNRLLGLPLYYAAQLLFAFLIGSA